jgi:hypothetical protein
MANESSPDWSTASVVARLRASAAPGKPVRAQVFLHDDVAADDLAAAVQNLVTTAEQKAGAQKTPVEVGKIHGLAKSFSITADPDVVAAIAEMPAVKAILPSEIDDIYPKPVKRSPG